MLICNNRYVFNQEFYMSHEQYRLANCEECGVAYRSARRHSRFCSAKCRMKNMRKGRAKEKKGAGKSVTGVTLSYLDALLPLAYTTPEDWQND